MAGPVQVVTWQQLGFHRKPIGLLNTRGFYDPLIAFVDRAVKEVGRLVARRTSHLCTSASLLHTRTKD